MREKLQKLSTLARDFFARRPAEATAPQGPTYYRMISVGPSLESDKRWEVDFFLSGSAHDPHAICPLTQRKVETLLEKNLGSQKPDLSLADKNHYVAGVDSEPRAKNLMVELVYVFAKEGIQPMAHCTPPRNTPPKP
ncbi:MAG: hypothetical protein PW788_13300 [Micavibrio sp.]|nr:hypothetical protein [Micavibrio sp.]